VAQSCVAGVNRCQAVSPRVHSIIGGSLRGSAASRTSEHSLDSDSCRRAQPNANAPSLLPTSLVFIILLSGPCGTSTRNHGLPRASCLCTFCHGSRHRVMDRTPTDTIQNTFRASTELWPTMATALRSSRQGAGWKPAATSALQMRAASSISGKTLSGW
jgi:hypothetical protein